MIPLSYTPIDSAALSKVLQRYEGQSHENLISDFELKLRDFTKAKHVIALNSGTASIHLALKAVGVGAHDEVLVSTFTYVATVNPILYLGATPVFIDVEMNSWNMDPGALELAIQDRIAKGILPKAILVVHTYGMPALMPHIMDISLRYNIPVVEDAAEALGSNIDNRSVGTLGEVGVVSFNNNKILTTYGGGALLTNNDELAKKVSFWAGQSRESKVFYEHKEVGYNYRMGAINAAVGLSKIGSIENEIHERKSSFRVYENLLCGNGFRFQVEKEGVSSNRWLTAVSVNDGSRLRAISDRLTKNGIETRRVWNPMHCQPLFNQYQFFTRNNAALFLFLNSLCLPFCKLKESERTSSLIREAVFHEG